MDTYEGELTLGSTGQPKPGQGSDCAEGIRADDGGEFACLHVDA